MGASNVPVGVLPLTRLNPWYPGQMGVPGTDTETGLRHSTTGAIFYVDPNYPGASDARDGTNPTDPLLTVQRAVDLCQEYRNDVIVVGMNSDWVHAGVATYSAPIQEAVTINKAGVRLMGIAPGLGVPWQVPSAGATCITVTAMDVLIEGFLFAGEDFGGDGIYVEWGGTLYGDNVVIRHCTFNDEIDTAIQLEFVYYADIHHNFFQQCDQYGIYVDPNGSGIQYAHIHNNWFQDCTLGALSLEKCVDSKIEYNNIYNRVAQSPAVATDLGINTDGGDRNLVTQNVLSCQLGAANGAYDDFCSPDDAVPANATDSWIQNYCENGPTTGNPA